MLEVASAGADSPPTGHPRRDGRLESNTVVILWLFAVGSCIGSFVNVCIHRLPREMSLLWPRSRCPACHTLIRWYQNIPILSYAMLGGKCAACKRGISSRYMLVEAITGLLFVGLYLRFRVVLREPISVYLVYSAFAAALVASTFIDIDFRIIPNEITFTGILAAPMLSLLVPQLHTHSGDRLRAVLLSVQGIAVSGVVVYGIALLGKLAFRKEALGFGDVKLMAFVGGIAGWQVAVIAFFVAPFFGLFMGIPNLVLRGKHVIPYGPFLSLSTLIVLCWRSEFVSLVTGRFWY